MKRWCVMVGVGVLLWASAAAAHDLGVQGNTWPIAEPSLIETIMKKVAGVNWEQKSKALLAKSKARMHNIPQDGLTTAKKTETYWVDPTMTLRKPLSAPVKDAQGKWHWKIIYPAGTKVNPLEKARPVTRMLVFNPTSRTQTAFAVAALHAWPTLIELVATGGDIKKTAKGIGRPVFYANKTMIDGFGLKHVPSLIGVGTGVHQYDLAITTFGPESLDPKEVKKTIAAAWYGLHDKSAKKGHAE